MVRKFINMSLFGCQCLPKLLFTTWFKLTAIFVLAVVLSGCAATTSVTRSDIDYLEDNPLSDDEVLETIFSPTLNVSKNSAARGTSNRLTLREVLNIAFENNPTLAEFTANRELALSAVLTANAWHNPKFDSDLRYVTGNGDDIEYELGLNQVFELPGKRRARQEAAEAVQLAVEQEETSFMVLLHAEVKKAYRSVIFRDAKINLEMQNLDLAKEIVAVVKKRVDAGEARPIELTRARVEELKARKQIQAARRLRNIARKVLNALCGGTLPPNFILLDPSPAQFKPASTEQVHTLAQSRHPKLKHLIALKRQKELELKREQVAWYPDFSPGVGFENEEDEDSYTISLGLELPLWNKNSGGIAKAKAELKRIGAQISRAKQDIVRDVDVVLETYEGALEQIHAFEELRSVAREALKTETFLYEQGEVDLLTLLDARRTTQETESEYLGALHDLHLSRIELEQTIGIIGD